MAALRARACGARRARRARIFLRIPRARASFSRLRGLRTVTPGVSRAGSFYAYRVRCTAFHIKSSRALCWHLKPTRARAPSTTFVFISCLLRCATPARMHTARIRSRTHAVYPPRGAYFAFLRARVARFLTPTLPPCVVYLHLRIRYFIAYVLRVESVLDIDLFARIVL